ncbi:hypothetical protein [Achromobacter ruhlandii]|uniref:hypothetical protein n=1 Tax=Achromobacter ruhlandii TaxID=72557 RepID=UPI003B9EE096
MTQQDDITQRVLTDDEILTATLYGQSEARMIRNGRAIESALLSKLRATVADERDRNATISQVVGLCNRIPGSTTWNAAQFMYDEMHRRASLASDPLAGKTRESVDYVRGGTLNFDAHPDGAPVADERTALQKLVDLEDMRLRLRALHESGHGTDYDHYHKALPAAWESARAALSAPQAEQGERDA